jgi:hypothetical protein
VPSTTTRSERRKRSVHHYRRGGSTPETYSCGYLGCVRTYAWAFPCQYYSRYCYLYCSAKRLRVGHRIAYRFGAQLS